MSEHDFYPNAPIVEAIFDVQMELPQNIEMAELEAFCKTFGSAYPEKKIQRKFGGKFEVQDNDKTFAEDAVFFGWKALARDELMTTYQDCCEQGWDGYDAASISLQTIFAGETLLELLPDYLMPPEVIPEPTGKISFEWRNAPGTVFVIAVDASSIAFAELMGSKKRYGEAKFLSTLPDDMKKTLLDYFGRSPV